MDKLDKLLTLYRAGSVERFHSVEVPSQKVSEHSWGVAMLAIELFPFHGHNLLKHILYHDTLEVFTGDIPATAKWASEEFREALKELEAGLEAKVPWVIPILSREDEFVLNVLDMLDLCFYCLREYWKGSKAGAIIGIRGLEYLEDLIEKNPIWLEEATLQGISCVRELISRIRSRLNSDLKLSQFSDDPVQQILKEKSDEAPF